MNKIIRTEKYPEPYTFVPSSCLGEVCESVGGGSIICWMAWLRALPSTSCAWLWRSSIPVSSSDRNSCWKLWPTSWLSGPRCLSARLALLFCDRHGDNNRVQSAVNLLRDILYFAVACNVFLCWGAKRNVYIFPPWELNCHRADF